MQEQLFKNLQQLYQRINWSKVSDDDSDVETCPVISQIKLIKKRFIL
jgi:hypothetical protein